MADIETSSSGTLVTTERPPRKPIRKDEIVIEDRGLYIESWLPERRSRRRPLYLVHGELAGSWVWVRYLEYFAQRGWEVHALNLRAHFWSETADFAALTFESYLADVAAGLARLGRPAVAVGHGLGGLLTLKLAESEALAGLVLISPGVPAGVPTGPRPRFMGGSAPHYRRDVVGWQGTPQQLLRANPDLSRTDVLRVQHMMSAESVAARQAMLTGVPLDPVAIAAVPTLVIGGGLDRLFPAPDSERLADWLGAQYEVFGAHSHYGLVVGEHSFQQVADTIRAFLEAHRL